jgi:hypothetical protein
MALGAVGGRRGKQHQACEDEALALALLAVRLVVVTRLRLATAHSAQQRRQEAALLLCAAVARRVLFGAATGQPLREPVEAAVARRRHLGCPPGRGNIVLPHRRIPGFGWSVCIVQRLFGSLHLRLV